MGKPVLDSVDPGAQFNRAAAYLIEWAKHIVTVGSALMVLGAALLQNLIIDSRAPFNYLSAGLVVLSYLAMVLALWHSLGFIRRVASSVFTATGVPSGDELKALRSKLDWAQRSFLAALFLFVSLVLVALVAWLLGFTGRVPTRDLFAGKTRVGLEFLDHHARKGGRPCTKHLLSNTIGL